MAFLLRFSQQTGTLEETDFFDRVERATGPELESLLKKGQNHFRNLGRFGLNDRIEINDADQRLALKPKL